MDDFDDLPLLPSELVEKWENIKKPFGGLFGNSVPIRVLSEIVADPDREFRPKDLERLADATAPSIKKSLETLTSLGLLEERLHDSQRPFYRVNLTSKRLTALTFLAYAIIDDRDGTNCMDVAIKDYCEEMYGLSAISGTIDITRDFEETTFTIETGAESSELLPRIFIGPINPGVFA